MQRFLLETYKFSVDSQGHKHKETERLLHEDDQAEKTDQNDYKNAVPQMHSKKYHLFSCFAQGEKLTFVWR